MFKRVSCNDDISLRFPEVKIMYDALITSNLNCYTNIKLYTHSNKNKQKKPNKKTRSLTKKGVDLQNGRNKILRLLVLSQQ